MLRTKGLAFLSTIVLSGHFSISTNQESTTDTDTEDITPTNHEARLIKVLLDSYRQRGRVARPVRNIHDVVNIEFGLTLLQIIDLDAKNQVLTLNVWDRYHWNDTYLTWDPAEHGGLTSVRLPFLEIWIPDITLYNYADERLKDHRDTLLTVYNNGLVYWVPQVMYKSSCKFDINNFPFDVQICILRFGSWTYPANMVDLDFLRGLRGFDMTEYTVNNEWRVEENVAVKRHHNSTDCKSVYQDMIFCLKVRRVSDLYVYILVFPCVLLSCLTLVVFWIPPHSPAKIQLGMNIFVAFFVMMLILEESIPTAAASVPLIGKYYMINMALITLSTFVAVMVANIALSTDGKPVPKAVRKILIEMIGKALCVRHFKVLKPMSHKELCDVDIGKVKSTENLKPSSPQLSASLEKLERDVDAISANVQRFLEKTTEIREKQTAANEWTTAARVVDRLLFCLFFTVTICSTFLMLPLTHGNSSCDEQWDN